MKQLIVVAAALAFAICGFSQDIPPTTLNSVTISGTVAQSRDGDGYVFSVTETNPGVPYIKLTVNMKHGKSISQLVTNSKTVNLVFVLTAEPVTSLVFQELGGGPPFEFSLPDSARRTAKAYRLGGGDAPQSLSALLQELGGGPPFDFSLPDSARN